MWRRILAFSDIHSFFLFGARGTGKSTLLKQRFKPEETLWIDLLDLQQEDELARNPQQLEAIVLGTSEKILRVVIDEVQKIPRLLDVVQKLMAITNKQFILTGSSAKKLRHGAANLLAGRAFVYHLYPFSFLELAATFDLGEALQYGLLPRVFHFKVAQEKQQFLQAYALTYLREEIWAEQLVKKLDPFRRFLEVAAQVNGKIINYARLARDVGVDDKTISHYFELLEDTLLGFFLEPFHSSFRKRLAKKAKFYFIDIGIARALSRTLTLSIQPGTSFYGELFEQFIVAEIYKLFHYYQPEYRLSFLQTKDDAEIDLVIERPGLPLCLIEIKSTASIDPSKLTSIKNIAEELNAEAYCLSNDPQIKKVGIVRALPWRQGIMEICGLSEHIK